jgi:serine/threonine-protein kinase RsbT
MTETCQEREMVKLPVTRVQDVLVARMVAREESIRLGFAARAVTQIASAVSEITRNVVQHAGAPGQVRMFNVVDKGRAGIKIVVEDLGCGICDVNGVLAGSSPGAGIPGCRSLMDEFGLRSSAGAGVAVEMVKWLPHT